MAGRSFSRRAPLHFTVPRVATCVVLVAGAALVSANPAAAAAPSAPTITRVTAGPGVGVMSLRWSFPRDTGGAPITGYEYRVQVDSDGFGPPQALAGALDKRGVAPCAAPAASGHTCSYQVRATNGTPGAWSVPVGASWLPPSATVVGKSVGGPAANTVTLQWRAPKMSGGLDVTYQYTVDAGSGPTGPLTIDPSTITVLSTVKFVVLSAPVPCFPTGAVLACTYVMTAVNAVGSSLPSRPRVAAFRHPVGPNGLQVYTSSVALSTGAAAQAVSWNAPNDVGGAALTDYLVWTCTTSSGSLCTNTAGGWSQIADLTGNPPATDASHDCPANGRCAYEVWAKNPLGKGWTVGYAGSGGPTNLTATVNGGQVSLSWVNPVDPGTFGHYIVFSCVGPQTCAHGGSWTNLPADLTPWTSEDQSGTATTATSVCGVGRQCVFRIGYIDALGNIGGVSNQVSVTGH